MNVIEDILYLLRKSKKNPKNAKKAYLLLEAKDAFDAAQATIKKTARDLFSDKYYPVLNNLFLVNGNIYRLVGFGEDLATYDSFYFIFKDFNGQLKYLDADTKITILSAIMTEDAIKIIEEHLTNDGWCDIPARPIIETGND